MPQATCNGVEIYYEVHGEGDPLLCVMGIGAQIPNWVFNIPAFSERYETVVFDNRDVGRSGYVDEEYTMADMAADTLALADHLELESFHLLGISMGGTISQELALVAPERIKTLTLAVTWPGGGRWWRVRGRALWLAVPHLTPDELLEHLLMLNLSAEAFENDELLARAMQRLRDNPYPQRPEGFFRQGKAVNRFDLRGRLGEIDIPTNVIAAERDVFVPAFMARQIAEEIPGAKFTVVDGAAHGMNMERALEFNKLVLDFLAEHATA